MPVRCPACHSDQTKPAPARNLLERMTGVLGRRAYFCEDCYRRFTPSKSNTPPTEEAQPPSPEAREAPQAAMLVETPAATTEPSPAKEDQETLAPAPPEEEGSLISRMRRQQMEEQRGFQDEASVSEKATRLTLPLSPAKLAGALGGAVLLIVLILWYRSSLDQPPPAAQAPATRVKISESAAPPRPEGLPSPATPSAPAPAAVPSPQAPSTREAAPPSTEPAGLAPLPMPPAPQAQAPPAAPAPPAPIRRSVSPAPARKAPMAKAKPPAAKPSAAKTQGNYAVQFGAFGQAPRAQTLAANLKAKGIQVQMVTVKGRDGKAWHKVRSAGLATREEAQRVQRKLEQSSGVKGMVVRVK